MERILFLYLKREIKSSGWISLKRVSAYIKFDRKDERWKSLTNTIMGSNLIHDSILNVIECKIDESIMVPANNNDNDEDDYGGCVMINDRPARSASICLRIE